MSRQVYCSRCGRRLNADAPRIYSTWTHNYYCTSITKCGKRAKRRSRAK